MSAYTDVESVDTQWLSDTLKRQNKAFLNLPYPAAAERRKRLETLKTMLKDNRDAICEAIDQDFSGRSSIDTLLADFLPSMMGITDAIRHLSGWMKPKRKIVPMVFQPASARVLPQPLGVIGIIVPWNYPLYLAIGPLVAALAAGNSAMIKMSESTPAFGALFEKLIREAFDASVVTVVNGNVEVAQAFSSLPFDHLLFTGSTTVGRQVMRSASDNLTPVTLELGGKSPVVIDRSMPVREAAERLVYPKCLNAGQSCVAPDYVFCPYDQVDDFVQHFIKEAKRQYGDIAANDHYTSIVNERHRNRLIGYLEAARAQGAKIHIAGPSDDLNQYGSKLPPILVTDVKDTMQLMQDEIFGPILPVLPYRQLDETLTYINARPRPLALYVFGYEKALQASFEQKTHSGALLFNDSLIHFGMHNLPVGGLGDSGMGHYHGRYGFETFSKLKPIVSKQRISSLVLLYPPHKGWLINLLLRLYGR